METRTDTRGLERFVRDLRAMKKRTTDLTVATKGSAAEMQKVLDQTFDAGRSPDGQAWAALKPSTVKKKKGAKPLVETGALRRSRQAKATKKGVGIEVQGNRARVAQILSRGTASMPARPVLPKFTKGGPAREALQKTLSRIARFVLRGSRR